MPYTKTETPTHASILLLSLQTLNKMAIINTSATSQSDTESGNGLVQVHCTFITLYSYRVEADTL